MKKAVVGAVVLAGVGVVLVVVGSVWHRAYNRQYTLTLREVLAGEPSGWLTLGPRNKQVAVIGFALRSQAARIPIQTSTRDGTITVDRVYIPLRMPEDNRAFLVSVPGNEFDDRILLYDTADQRIEFAGVIDLTPKSKGGRSIEHRFRDVTLPSRHCLVLGEEGGWQQPKWLIVSGAGLIVAAALLVGVTLLRQGTLDGTVPQPMGVPRPPTAAPPVQEFQPAAESANQTARDKDSTADIMAAMSAGAGERSANDAGAAGTDGEAVLPPPQMPEGGTAGGRNEGGPGGQGHHDAGGTGNA